MMIILIIILIHLLEFYIDKLNKDKGINKYFKNIFQDENLDLKKKIIIDYLEQFKPNFIENIKKHAKK